MWLIIFNKTNLLTVFIFLFFGSLSNLFLQALALIELYNAPEGRYKQDVYLLPKKMGKTDFTLNKNL